MNKFTVTLLMSTAVLHGYLGIQLFSFIIQMIINPKLIYLNFYPLNGCVLLKRPTTLIM